MKLVYKLEKKSQKNMARLGSFTYNGKKYMTPMFMPVGTNATVKTLSPEELKDIGYIERVGSDRKGYWRVNYT